MSPATTLHSPPHHLLDRAFAAGGAEGLWVQYDGGHRAPLDVGAWVGHVSAADASVLRRCVGPVLDVGCGPGRLLRSLRSRGVACLGVDLSPAAVARGRAEGLPVQLGSVFDAGLAPASWSTALLLDGSVGIGGDPVALLRRVRELLRPTGRLIVELGRDEVGSGSHRVRLETGSELSEWFAWGEVTRSGVGELAGEAAYGVSRSWQHSGRWFAELHQVSTVGLAA